MIFQGNVIGEEGGKAFAASLANNKNSVVVYLNLQGSLVFVVLLPSVSLSLLY